MARGIETKLDEARRELTQITRKHTEALLQFHTISRKLEVLEASGSLNAQESLSAFLDLGRERNRLQKQIDQLNEEKQQTESNEHTYWEEFRQSLNKDPKQPERMLSTSEVSLPSMKPSTKHPLPDFDWDALIQECTSKKPALAVHASKLQENSVMLSWNPHSEAKSYSIQVKPTGSDQFTTIATSVTSTSYTVKSLDLGTDYTIQVLADMRPQKIGILAVRPISRPLTLKTGSIRSNSIALKWSSNNSSAKHYQIERRKVGEHWFSQPDHFVTNNQTGDEYTVENLENGIDYEFRVRSGVHPTYEGTGTTLNARALAAPDNGKATGVVQDGARITWNAVTGASRYKVMYKHEHEEKYTEISEYVPDTFVDLAGLKTGLKYDVLVYAGSALGLEDKGMIKSFYPLATVTNLKSEEKEGSRITITWNGVPSATVYRIQQKQPDDKYVSVADVSTPTFTSRGTRVSGITYPVRVFAGANGTFETVGREMELSYYLTREDGTNYNAIMTRQGSRPRYGSVYNSRGGLVPLPPPRTAGDAPSRPGRLLGVHSPQQVRASLKVSSTLSRAYASTGSPQALSLAPTTSFSSQDEPIIDAHQLLGFMSTPPVIEERSRLESPAHQHQQPYVNSDESDESDVGTPGVNRRLSLVEEQPDESDASGEGAPVKGKQKVERVLASLGLERFGPAVFDIGVESVSDLKDVEDSDLTAMGLKKIEINRFRRATNSTE